MTNTTQYRILVIDDSANMRHMIKSALKDLGFTRLTDAENGAAGLNYLKTMPFDLVFLDWNMPVLSGLEVLRILRADEELKGLPVIMLTAEAQKDQILEAIGCGASDYIVKPFTVGTLKEKIERIMKISL